jgi:putative membrane protein (TIGR04086 family)
MKNKKTNAQSGFYSIFRPILLSILSTAAISVALLLAGTAAAYLTPDPTAFVTPLGYVTLFMAAFFGGFAASKINKREPYLTSILTGLGFILLSAVSSLALPHTLSSGTELAVSILLRTLTLLTFPLGALVGIKASKPRKHKRRKR